MLESNQQPCPRAKGQAEVAQHPSLSSFQMLQPTQVRVKEVGSLFSRTVRLTGEKVSLGQRKWNWIQLGGYLSSLWPMVVSSDSTSANGPTHTCEFNYWVPAFNAGSGALDLIWFKRIEQKGKRRGNQTPLGILFESTKRLDWNLQSIYKEAVKSFIRLKGVGRETQEVRQ